MRLKLIACEIFARELAALAARSPHTVDLEFLPKGLHDLPSGGMRERVQRAIDATPDGRYERILLGYGLCNNGLAGVRARRTPLVLPRSHDCIGLFLGRPERYLELFHSKPGTYFLTPGWMERAEVDEELKPLSIPHRLGLDTPYDDLVRQFGEDNARYIVETLAGGVGHYRRYLYIRTGVADDDAFERAAAARAAERKWEFDTLAGDLDWLRRLVDGPWPPDLFLEVPPGRVVRSSPADGVVGLEPAEGEAQDDPALGDPL